MIPSLINTFLAPGNTAHLKVFNVKSKYDPVLKGQEEIEKYIKEKNIKAQHNIDE